MAGERIRVTDEGRKRIDDAVEAAEEMTGLEFCVYLGPAHEDTRAEAEAMFVEAGLIERPAVLLFVAPDQRKVEIVTAPHARERLTDDECAATITEMTPYLARGDFVEGLEVGLHELAKRTGAGTAPEGATELPNVLDRYQALAVEALTTERPPSRGAMIAGVLVLALLLGAPASLLVKRISSTPSCEPPAFLSAIERDLGAPGAFKEINVAECRGRYALISAVSSGPNLKEQMYLHHDGDRWNVIPYAITCQHEDLMGDLKPLCERLGLSPASVSGRF